MGFVILAGLWEPATAVSLYGVPAERVMRSEGGRLVGRRLSDAAGSVGFDGLVSGTRFIAEGYDAGGNRVSLRCRAVTEAEGSHTAQPPISRPAQSIGTQEAPLPVHAPAQPFAMLQVGVPDGVPLGVALAA